MRRGLLVVMMLVALLSVAVPAMPASATSSTPLNQLLFWDDFGGTTFTTFGPNSAVVIGAGAFAAIPAGPAFDSYCHGTGVADGITPAADVYVVPAGSVSDGSKLTDVSGQSHEISEGGSSTGFLDQQIGVTAPQGKIGPGSYAVVYDECQDGYYNAGTDALFDPAFSVVFPPTNVPPLPNASVTATKNAASQAELRWAQIGNTVEEHLAYLEMQDEIECISDLIECYLGTDALLGYATSWAESYLNLESDPEEAALTEIFNMIHHYSAIAADPPDPNFQQSTTLTPVSPIDPQSNDPLVAGAIGIGNAAGDEGALAEGLLNAMQRYQGAAAAQDGAWALVHAREIQVFAGELAGQLGDSNGQLTAWSNAVASDPRDLDSINSSVSQLAQQLAGSGYTADQIRELRNLGLTQAEMDSVKAAITGLDYSQGTRAATLADLSAMIDANNATIVALQSLQHDMSGIIDTLAADPSVYQSIPVAVPGGPYSASEGAPITLDGSASTSPAGTIVTWEWDTNFDGRFDDATGPNPTVTFNHAFSGLIGLRVTDDQGHVGISYARVSVSSANQPPVIDSASPAGGQVSILLGNSQDFSVGTSDPDGDATSVSWTVDGSAAGSGASFHYTAPSDMSAVGIHVVRAIASDTTPFSHQIAQTWWVTVLAPDADGDGWNANVDCNDNNAAINPGATEIIGNGIDDDCNPATPDAGSPPSAGFNVAPTPERNVALYDGTADGSQIVRYSSAWTPDVDPRAMLDAAASYRDAPWFTDIGQNTDQYVVFSLAGGQTYLVDRVQVMPPPVFYQSAGVKDFAIDVSTTTSDDSAFTTVLTGTTVEAGGLQTYVLSQPVEAKYIRYRPLDNWGDTNYKFIATQQLTVLTPLAGGNTVALSDASTPGSGAIVAWSWDFGDGTTSTQQNPSHTFPAPGQYTIGLTVTDTLGHTGSTTQTYTAYAPLFPLPGPPTNLGATPGSQSAIVTWDPPADTAGVPVDLYDISADNGFHTTVPGSGPLTASVTGLSDGVTHTITVKAHTAPGFSAGATVTVVPVDPPNAPTNVHAAPADGGLVVTWTAPFANGGTIDYYTATLTLGGSAVASQQVTGTQAVFSGLSNGTTYTVSVTAHNQYGSGPAASAQGTPTTAPTAPTNLAVIPGDGQLTVFWSPPQSTIPILHYHVNVSGHSYTDDYDVPVTCSDTTCATEVIGLTDGVSYTVSIAAVNESGTGESAGITGTPVSTPTNLTPATTFYITRRNGAAVAKVTLDPTSGSVQTDNGFVSNLPASGPDSLVFDHHGNMIVSNTDVQTLSLIDPKTGAILKSSITSTPIFGVTDLALDPNSDTVAVISWDTGGLYLVDLDTGMTTQIPLSFTVKLGGIAYNGDGSRLFVSSHDGWIYEIDPHTGARLRGVDVGGDPDGMTFDPTTQHVFVAGCAGICDLYIGSNAQPTLLLVKSYETPSADGMAADGQGHIFFIAPGIYGALDRLDLATGKVTTVASSEYNGWDDVAPVVGAGAPNTPPQAADQSVSTSQDTPLPITLGASDAEGDTLTYSVVAGPSHGSLSGTAPNLTYTPSSGYSGADSFTFKANDGQADSNVATVSITVKAVNQPPVLGTLTDQQIDFNDALSFDISATDPDHDPITLNVTGLPAGLSFRDNGDGTGTVSGTVTADPGSFPLQISASDDHGHTVTGSLSITVVREDAALTYTGATSADFNDSVTVSATLTDPKDNTPVGGKVVTFTLNGAESCQASTGSDGSASCRLTPGEPAGSYTLAVAFSGDPDYQAASAAPGFTVQLEQAALSLTSSPTLAVGKVTVTAALTEDGTSPVEGRSVVFTATPNGGGAAVTGTAGTGSDGTASTLLDLPVGDYTLAAHFAGDSYYQSADAAAQAHLYVYQPSQFVIWGGNSPGTAASPNVALGNDYTFWGAQWSKQVTGGSYGAGASFKGYADSLSADGTTWTARTGNSSAPPASVAQFIGVLVTTSASKSGSTISGNVAEIVVIEVDDPGSYRPDPGHPATGVVVAVVH